MAKPPGIFDENGKWNDNGVWDDKAVWGGQPSDESPDDEPGNRHLLAEDGRVLTTEDGSPIELEGADQLTEKPLDDSSTQEGYVSSEPWTGHRTKRQQAMAIRALAPLALREIDHLIAAVEAQRYNDKPTQDAIELLRTLHQQLGALLQDVDSQPLAGQALAAIESNRRTIFSYLVAGTKLTVLAPAATIGIMHILALVSGLNTDMSSMATVYAALLGHDALKSYKSA